MHQFVVGNLYVFSSDDFRALVAHLQAEAPHLLSSVVVAVPDVETARRLASTGVTALVSPARHGVQPEGITELLFEPRAPTALGALATWRFWAVAGAAIVDAVLIVPVTLITVLLGALWFPSLLRRASQFLGSLATAAEARR